MPPTVLYSVFAEHFVSNFSSFETEQIVQIFSEIEKNLVQKNEPESTIELTGFVESLLNRDSAGEFVFANVVEFLGSQTREFCIAVNRFSSVKTKGLDH